MCGVSAACSRGASLGVVRGAAVGAGVAAVALAAAVMSLGAATCLRAEAQPTTALPRVRLVATGGTISNRAGRRLTADELVASVPGLGRWASVESEQFSNVSSSELTLAQWLRLSQRINDVFRSDRALSGVVVTMGTDTLEELAYFLHLTIRDERPVVVVGSMRNPNTVGYEGPANLLAGIRAAADPASRGLGTLVVLNDEINSAREATKTDALRLETFQSRAVGLLGVVDADRVVYYRRPLRRHSAHSEFDVTRIDVLPRIDVLLAYQDAPGDLIKAAVDAGAKGLVIAAAGAGATSGTQRDGIGYASGRRVPVVLSTRTGGGRVAAGRGPGAQGPNGPTEDGAASTTISGEDLSPVKARVLLMLALSRSSDRGDIQRMFQEY